MTSIMLPLKDGVSPSAGCDSSMAPVEGRRERIGLVWGNFNGGFWVVDVGIAGGRGLGNWGSLGFDGEGRWDGGRGMCWCWGWLLSGVQRWSEPR
jgi:hypothetical protein